MLIVRHLGTPNSDFNGCHCMRDPVLYRSMVYIMYVTHHKLTAPLNWAARNQYSCRPILNDNHYTRINTHIY